jgi:hypothetical protein
VRHSCNVDGVFEEDDGVIAAVEGQLPRGINIERLRDPDRTGLSDSRISALIRTDSRVGRCSIWEFFKMYACRCLCRYDGIEQRQLSCHQMPDFCLAISSKNKH